MFPFVSINGLQLNHVLLSYQFMEVFLATLFIEHLGLPFKVLIFRSAFNFPKPSLHRPRTQHTSSTDFPTQCVFDMLKVHLYTHTGVGMYEVWRVSINSRKHLSAQ